MVIRKRAPLRGTLVEIDPPSFLQLFVPFLQLIAWQKDWRQKQKNIGIPTNGIVTKILQGQSKQKNIDFQLMKISSEISAINSHPEVPSMGWCGYLAWNLSEDVEGGWYAVPSTWHFESTDPNLSTLNLRFSSSSHHPQVAKNTTFNLQRTTKTPSTHFDSPIHRLTARVKFVQGTPSS